jgi:hypothetical protein
MARYGNVPTFYTLDSLDEPDSLLRDARDTPGMEPYSHFDVSVGDWVPDSALGAWLIRGELSLVKVPHHMVEAFRQAILLRHNKLTASSSVAATPLSTGKGQGDPAPKPEVSSTIFRPDMTKAEGKAAVDAFSKSLRDGTFRAEAEAKLDPEWVAKYSDQAWRAALVQLGYPEDYGDSSPDVAEATRVSNDVDERGWPLPPRPWRYSDRLLEAMAAAAQIHGAQPRKGTTIPYLSHLLGTSSIALDYGASEDEAIAALLHDAIEDGQPTEAARATVWSFGDEVGRIVEGCTDADTHPKPPWRVRKEAYLTRLAHEDRSTLLVSASDKLHNARSIVRDLRVVGEDLWARFSVQKDKTLWYYRALVTAYRGNPAHTPALIDELDRTVTEMEALAGRVP